MVCLTVLHFRKRVARFVMWPTSSLATTTFQGKGFRHFKKPLNRINLSRLLHSRATLGTNVHKMPQASNAVDAECAKLADLQHTYYAFRMCDVCCVTKAGMSHVVSASGSMCNVHCIGAAGICAACLFTRTACQISIYTRIFPFESNLIVDWYLYPIYYITTPRPGCSLCSLVPYVP